MKSLKIVFFLALVILISSCATTYKYISPDHLEYVTKKSNNDIVFGKDVRLTKFDGSNLYILEKEKVYESLKQNLAPYLIYLLISPVSSISFNDSFDDFQLKYSPKGHLVGVALSAFNILGANIANKNFKENLFLYYVNHNTIKKGETFYGFIGI